ncbi:GlxA family transcriptional regulator [Nocardia sp. NPDC004711]
MPRRRTTVAVLVFDQAPLFETSVPISVFGVDRSAHGVPRFELLTIAAGTAPIATTGGLRLHAPYGLDALGRAGVVIVPGWPDPEADPPASVLDAIRAAHADGAVTVSLCMGAFVLAAAGLLDGRRAATHWVHAPTLAARYPSIRVDPQVLYIDDGDVITSAGTAAGLDACLHVVRRLWGTEAAATIARRMVVPPHRSGGQAQYFDQPLTDIDHDDDLTAAITYALTHLDEPITIDTLARAAGHSRRSFDRHFRARAGISPLQWLLHQRILHARRLLETTDLSIDTIATQVGFTNAIALRPHFRRLLDTTPQHYRNTYRGTHTPTTDTHTTAPT